MTNLTVAIVHGLMHPVTRSSVRVYLIDSKPLSHMHAASLRVVHRGYAAKSVAFRR